MEEPRRYGHNGADMDGNRRSCAKGRRHAAWAAAVACAVVLGGAVVLKDFLLETWYCHCLDTTDSQERERATKKLGELHSTRAVPKLLAILAEPRASPSRDFPVEIQVHDVSELVERLEHGAAGAAPARDPYPRWACFVSSQSDEVHDLLMMLIKELTGGDEAWSEPVSGDIDDERQLHVVATSELHLRLAAAVALLKTLPYSALAREAVANSLKDAGDDNREAIAQLSSSRTR